MRLKILKLLLLLAAVLGVGTAAYMLIENVSLIDAVYMTVISVTTVGYQEVFPLSLAGKLFTIVLIISGLGIVFYIAQVIVEDTMEGRIRKILGRRKMEKNISRMKAHVVLAGFGRMGEVVCRDLALLGRDFLIIEKTPERYAAAEERNFHVLNADAADEDVLRAAGIDKARVFISLLADDADNIFTVLTARELNPGLFIITRALDNVNEKKLFRVGADRVISPYALSSSRIVSMVQKPNVIDFFDSMIGGQREDLHLSLEEHVVGADAALAGRLIKDAGLREKYNAIIVAIRREGRMIFNPSPDLTIERDDLLILMGERERLRGLR